MTGLLVRAADTLRQRYWRLFTFLQLRFWHFFFVFPDA